MERKLLLKNLDEILSQLDECVEGEEAEELAAELEDAIFLLECAEDDEESDGALEEIAAIAAQIGELADDDAALGELAKRLAWLAGA